MTHEEAKRKAEALAPIVFTDRINDHRAEIAELYMAVCGKTLPTCRCKDKVRDALLLVISTLKKTKKMENGKKTRLCRGFYFWLDGHPYNNNNITDDIARKYLAKNPHHDYLFEVLPDAVDAPAEASDAPAKASEVSEKPKKGKKRGSNAAKSDAPAEADENTDAADAATPETDAEADAATETEAAPAEEVTEEADAPAEADENDAE